MKTAHIIKKSQLSKEELASIRNEIEFIQCGGESKYTITEGPSAFWVEENEDT